MDRWRVATCQVQERISKYQEALFLVRASQVSAFEARRTAPADFGETRSEPHEMQCGTGPAWIRGWRRESTPLTHYSSASQVATVSHPIASRRLTTGLRPSLDGGGACFRAIVPRNQQLTRSGTESAYRCRTSGESQLPSLRATAEYALPQRPVRDCPVVSTNMKDELLSPDGTRRSSSSVSSATIPATRSARSECG